MIKQVPIPVYIDNALIKHQNLWTLAVDEDCVDRQCWGLAYGGRLTHMCYGMDYAAPTEALERVKTNEWWYFDAGRKLRVKVSDLKKAFEQLGLIKE